MTETSKSVSPLDSGSENPQEPANDQVPRVDDPVAQPMQSSDSFPEASSEAAIQAAQEYADKRARSKISRACDSCRKKKIKCDYGNTETEMCSNCTKNGDKCTFDRIPLKRGPSKGYNSAKSLNPDGSTKVVKKTPRRKRSDSTSSSGSAAAAASILVSGSRPNSVSMEKNGPFSLPPLQNIGNGSTTAAGPIVVPAPTAPGLGTQFWKVPFHDSYASSARRGSMDSINSSTSDGRSSLNFSSNGSMLDEEFLRRNSRANIPTSPSLSVSSTQSLRTPGYFQRHNDSISSPATNSGQFGSGIPPPPRLQLPLQAKSPGGSFAELIAVYYKCIHVNFPVIPLTKEMLSECLSQNETNYNDLANFVQNLFIRVLELVVSVCTTKEFSKMELNHQLNELIPHLLNVNYSLTDLPPKPKILYLSSYAMLAYLVSMLGAQDDIIMGICLGALNNAGIYRLVLENGDTILSRLYINIHILNSVSSIFNGSPKLATPLMGSAQQLLSYYQKLQPTEQMAESLRMGLLLSKLSDLRLHSNPAEIESIFNEFISQGNTIPANFSKVLYLRNKFKYLLKQKRSRGNQLEYNIELSEVVIQLVTCINLVLKEIVAVNPTNSIDPNPLAQSANVSLSQYGNNFYGNLLNSSQQQNSSQQGTVSPFAVAITRQLFKLTDLIKNTATHMIPLVVSDNGIVVKLSNAMNQLIEITSYLSVMRPFKITEIQNKTTGLVLQAGDDVFERISQELEKDDMFGWAN